MKQTIARTLESTLLRILEAEPEINLPDAVERVLELGRDKDFNLIEESELKNILVEICNKYTKQGVINPVWLESKGLSLHFFLINAEPEWLEDLTKLSSEKKEGISQYIIYGNWDSLLILSGTVNEAEQQLQEISRIVRHDETKYFSAREVPYMNRYRSRQLNRESESVNTDIVNEIALNYENESLLNERQLLEERSVFLGPAWNFKSFVSERIIAFTGIRLRGLDDISGFALLDLFLKNDVLKKTLVHLFKIDNARPFDFFAKLACESMEELDKATNAMSLTRLGRIRLESHTMVASRGIDQPRLYRVSSIRKVGRRPQVEDLQFLAKEIITPYGSEAVEIFNQLNSRRKLSILVGLQDFQLQFEAATWDPEWTERIKRSVEIFARSVLRNSDQVHLTGAVTEVTSAVEGAVKRALRVLAEQIYGKNYARAQAELKLPTKDFRRLSLGKCTNALRQMKNVEAFKPIVISLTDEWIERIEWFTEERNIWAHDAVNTINDDDLIDRAHRVIVEGMEIARWIHTRLLKVSEQEFTEEVELEQLILPREPEDREIGFFISYSSEDKAIAGRIATSLRAVDYKIWYDDWEIKHGDSIVSKIEHGLAQNDTLLILLSPSSVISKWVQRELSAALMRQLGGQNVKILPIMIADCEVPQILADIKYIDFRHDFQDGIITLMSTLAERKKEL